MSAPRASLPFMGRDSDAEHRRVGDSAACSVIGDDPDFPTLTAARSFPPHEGEGG
jgi:hypothetical protein